MKKLLKIFKNILCFLGIHNWNTKIENISFNLPDNSNRKFNSNRGFRLCLNCYKCQHTGIGILSDKWMTETEKQIKFRQPIIRKIKLKKIMNNIE